MPVVQLPAAAPHTRVVSAVDLSWEVHRCFHALSDLTFASPSRGLVPTGHVFGVLSDVSLLSRTSDLVLLVMDSPCLERESLFQGYKASRRSGKPSGDPLRDYNPFVDLDSILMLCSRFPNVRRVRVEGFEADDIMASLIEASRSSDSEFHLYFSDWDIMQTPGRFFWHRDFSSGPLDALGRVRSKFGYDLGFLPLFHKIIRGDPSDGIPPSLRGFPSRLLLELSRTIPSERDLDAIISAVVSVSSSSKTWSERTAPLLDPDSRLYKDFARNHALVIPRPPKPFMVRPGLLPTPPDGDYGRLLDSFGISGAVLR